MAIKIFEDKCIGCGVCINTCPFGAITMEAGKAVITDSCTSCGACVDVCAVKAIFREDECSTTDVDKSQFKDIWVYLEVNEGKLENVGLELLGQGRKLANALGQQLIGIIIGDNVFGLAQEAIAHGADSIYLVEDPLLKYYNTDGYCNSLVNLINTYKPSVILLGATRNGRDLGPRVACRVKTGLTADCTDLGIDDETGLVAWTRPAFGGNIMATILCPEHRPQMGTVRPAVFKKPTPDATKKGKIIRLDLEVKPKDIRTKLVEVIKITKENIKLEDAEIIISGGRGIGKPENFALLRELADVLGGVVGASRATVDAGWISPEHQIGQTGKSVAPKIYFAFGISGAIQHVAGMSSSDVIIAVNKDANAPIFSIADYGIVGDALEILPLMIEKFKEIKNIE
ncbi:MAG: FAD-binding protein [Peptococcales bacterium]|jgi:electron transfer flavoprotein alpha subunit